MKKSSLPGMIKYTSIKKALADISKKAEEKHHADLRRATEIRRGK